MSAAAAKRLLALVCAAALWSAAGEPARAQPGSLPMGEVCPSIDEDGELCANDLASGNCADFVEAAARLGGLYRDELERLPGSQASLLTTIWWGCGSANLRDVKNLLGQIGTPRALTVLAAEPFPSLPGSLLPRRPPAPVAPAPDCEGLGSPSDRSACIDARLQAARADHQRAVERCSGLVPPIQRDDLSSEEASFQALLPARCDAQAAAYDDPSEQAFARSRCLAGALAERTRALRNEYPECAAPGA